jgi:hypothetical protein
MADGDKIPDHDRVARLVKDKHVLSDGPTPIEIWHEAFTLRENEEFYSVCWLDHATSQGKIKSKFAIECFRNAPLTVKSEAYIIIGKIEKIRIYCSPVNINVIHKPELNYEAHAGIYDLDQIDFQTRDQLGNSFCRAFKVKDIDAGVVDF